MCGVFDDLPEATKSQDSEDENPENANPAENDKRKRKTLLLLNWLWLVVSGATIAVAVLYYELGIVNFIFNNKTIFGKPLSNLSHDELKEFAVYRNSANEYVLRLLTDPTDRFTKRKPLWASFDIDKQIVEAIRNESHTAKYALKFSQFAKYFLESEKACDEFTIFDMRNRALRLDVVWFYSTNIAQNLRMAINVRINKLVEEGHIAEWIRGQVPSDEYPCGDVPGPIPGVDILGPILMLLPFIIGMFGVLIRRRIRLHRLKRRGKRNRSNGVMVPKNI